MKEKTIITASERFDKEVEEESSFNLQAIISTLIIYWQWFVVSIVICLMAAFIYLRYARPVYEITAKVLIKNQDNSRSRSGNSMLSNMQDLGIMTNSVGIDNEVEILQAHVLAEQAVKDLKLYVDYKAKGRVKDQLIYKNNPLNVDLDPIHLDQLKVPIDITISKSGNLYEVQGKTYNNEGEAIPFDASFTSLPVTITTHKGVLTITKNPGFTFKDRAMIVSIIPPKTVATNYVNAMTVEPTSKTTDIALLTIHDIDPERASDYLKQLAVCYNRQANLDKNEVAEKTEAFINNRLEKINAELGNTEGTLESYKKRNKLANLTLDATSTITGTSTYQQKLSEANTQIQLLDYLSEYISNPENKMQVIPSNVGLTDESSTSLIVKYNEAVLERNRLLRSASENSPTVQTYTNTISELSSSIRSALNQAHRGMDIQRQGIEKQYNIYNSKFENSPEQERILTQIGRQQEVKSGLYLMLLQKREENSISLAATADKGKLIDDPQFIGKISPKTNLIWMIAFVIGLAIPFLVFYILQMLRYKIEGHEDVVKLTKIPILADIAIAKTQKSRGDIVVHENKNSQMEEVFRSLRTNLQFVMKSTDKVILFTSTTSGEGKTFTASNLAISFALLGKKVLIIGLDIRKPRLGQLFELHGHGHGITTFLCADNPDKELIKEQIIKSDINENLDLILAGPIPPNPAELLARNSLDKAIEYLKEDYEYIILDTAPVGMVSDTLLIGRVADATVYLCKADYTPKASFGLVNSLYEQEKLPNINIVLNGVDMTKKKYGYYYGYGKYGKYSHYGSHYGYGYGYGYGYDGTYGDIDNNRKEGEDIIKEK